MSRLSRTCGILVIGVVGLTGLIGCHQQQNERPTSMRGKAPSIDVMEPEIVDITAVTPEEMGTPEELGGKEELGGTTEPAPEIPSVTLPQSDLAHCFVKVGDVIPTVDLPLPGDATAQSLDTLRGTKATVLLLWNPENLYSVQGLEMLNTELPKTFGADLDAKRLAIVAVASSATPETVGDTVAASEVSYPVLVDADGSWCAKVADKPYRLFLLDANGTIAWFDLECGDASLRDLKVGITSLLRTEN